MKKVLAISVLVLVLVLGSFSTVFAADVTIDFVKGGASEDFVTANKEGPNGFFGPYWGDEKGALTMNSTDGVVLDLSATNAWMTLEVSPQETATTKYAVIVAKTDDPSAINGFTMTFGTDANDKQKGMLWADWGLDPLTTEFKTYVVDLAGNGVTTVPGAFGPDFALNRGEATGGKIYIKSILLTDTAPADNGGSDNKTTEAPKDNNDVTTTAAPNNNNAATTTAAPNNDTPGTTASSQVDTGVEDMGLAIAVAGIAAAALAVAAKKRSK